MDDFFAADVGALFPNLQIGPFWLILIGVAIGIFVAGRFPGLFNVLPGFFVKPEPQEAVEDRMVDKVVEKLRPIMTK